MSRLCCFARCVRARCQVSVKIRLGFRFCVFSRRLASGTREARSRRKTTAENTEAKTLANISAFRQFSQQIQLSPLSYLRRARARERSGASEASVA
uniref:Secreted protein n=1 Tax=Globodera rostochiensis TaxID=31243 RepID=A0A914GVK8_GLORO